MIRGMKKIVAVSLAAGAATLVTVWRKVVRDNESPEDEIAMEPGMPLDASPKPAGGQTPGARRDSGGARTPDAASKTSRPAGDAASGSTGADGKRPATAAPAATPKTASTGKPPSPAKSATGAGSAATAKSPAAKSPRTKAPAAKSPKVEAPQTRASATPGPGAGSSPVAKAPAAKSKTGGSAGTRTATDSSSRAELYKIAQELGIQGRSTMSKAELLRAIRAAG